MTAHAKRWLELLEQDYGVTPEFAGHMAPVLEKLERQDPSSEEWDQILHGLVAAFRSTRARSNRSADEVSVIVDEFLGELRKMDESLKVLGAFLERLQQRMSLTGQSGERVLH